MKVSTSHPLLQIAATANNSTKQQNRKPALFMRWILALLMMVTLGANAQVVSVTNPGNTTPALSATYGSLALAITDLNTRTAISGPVTITLNAGNPQTNPAGGYSISPILTGASNTNRVTIAGSGNTITAPNPAGTAGNLNDAIFKIIGSDFITISGFVMNENVLNTTTTAASNNMVEWGVALLYASTTNGAQNNIIENNTITLNRTYQNTFGIYSNSTHSSTAPTTNVTATTTAGGNSGLKIYGNTISNVNEGIVVVGPTAAADFNTGIDIGGAGGAQANTISNFGTTGTISGYANVSGTVYGILMRNSIGFNISFNSITSSVGGVTSGTLRGIYNVSATNTPTGTYTNTINNNTIALTYGVASGTLQGITVELTNATTTSIQNINNNNFTALTASIPTSAAITAISTVAPHLTLNVNSNTFTNITTNTTGSFIFVQHGYSMPAAGSQTFNNNSIVTGFNKTGAGGTVTLFTTGGSSPNGTTHALTNNNFSNITVTGATGITGVTNTDGFSTSPTKTCTGNTFNNWTGGTSSITCISYGYVGATTSSISSNTLTNITGQSTVTGITIGSSFNGATPLNIASNTITNLTSTGTGGAVTGITCSNTSTLININNNAVSTLASTAAAAVQGIVVSGAAPAINVFKNTICDLSGSNASTTVNGIAVGAGTTVTVYNNRIGDLRASVANAANPVVGLNITGGTTVNCYYNTVNLNASSSGALFGSSAISASTTPTLTLNNNIFVNTSTTTGAGVAVAYRRSTATLTSYAGTSNRNDFFASTIYTDGITPQASLAAYKVLVATRDANSIDVNPSFLSTTCGNANFLKINTVIATQLEGGGAPVGGITDDFEGDARNGSTPDIGADEFAGTPASVCGGTPAASTINGANSVCSGLGTSLSLSTVYTDLGITYQWSSGTTPGGPYGTTLGTSATQATGPLTANTYYICVITCTNSGLSFTTVEKSVLVNALPTVTVSPTSASICQPGGSAVTLTAGGAVTYAWSPTSGLTPTSGSPVSALPAGTTTYTVTGTDANGCVNTATSTITVSSSISAAATATPSSVCSGSNAQLDVAVSALNGVIKITEVCLNRGGTGGGVYPGFAPGADLIEVTNISSSPVDISGWTLSDHATNTAAATHTGFAFPASTIIPANSVAVVCLGTGTNDLVNRYFNTGGSNDFWLSSGLVGIVLKNGAAVMDAVGCGSGYVFNAGTGVTAGDWSGFAPSGSGLAGTTRIVSNDNNIGGDWSPSNITTQTIGVYNPGFTNPVSIASYAWSPSTFIAGQESLQNPLATAVTSTTTYSVTVTTTQGCTATTTTTVTVDPLVALAATFSSPNCAGSNFTVSANRTGGGAPFNYAWSDGVGGVYPNAQTVTANLAAGTYTFNCTITDACGGSVNSIVNVTVNGLPTVTITPTPGTARICGTGSVSLAAGGAATYAWSPITALTPTSGSPVTANPTTTTAYTVTGTDGNGCVATATQTVTVGPAVTVAPTATPSTICSGATSALNAVASTSPALNYTVAGITPAAETPSGGFTNLVSAGVYTPAPSGTATTPQDDGYWDGITLPFTFNYYGVNYTSVRISTNGNVQFGAITLGTAGNPGAASWTPNTIPTAGGNLDNFIGGPMMDQDLRTVSGGTLRYFVNGTSPNQKFVISYEACKVFSSSDLNTSQIILNENGTIDVLLLGGGTTATTTKAIGIENVGGTLGVAAPGRNAGTWTTPADEAWRFTPAALNYAWTPATGLTPSASVSNPTTPALTSTTTYTVTATEAVSGCSATGNVTVTVTPTANAGIVSGTSPLCIGGTATYSSTGFVLGGGTGAWSSSSPSVASVNPTSGLVTALAAGTTNITFTITGGCGGTVSAFQTLTVAPNANAGTVSGTSPLCTGGTATYSSTGDAGGTWSSDNGSVATVNPTSGLVTALSAGSVNITYTVTGCNGPASASQSVTVNGPYTLTYTAGAGGSISGASPQTVNCGDNGSSVTAVPNTCYSFVNWSDGNTNATRTDLNIQANLNVTANFAIITYFATVSAGFNGNITPGEGTVNCGSNVTYTFTPISSCHRISNVVLNGVSQGPVSSLSVNNVSANYTLLAFFELIPYTITVSAGANGSISPSTGIVNCGSSATYTITPDACYSIADVVVDGVSQGALSTYTFTNVTAPHTISASFTAIPNANAGTVSGTSPLCIGGTATYSATGVVFSGGTGAWSSTNPSVASVNPTSGLVTALAAGLTNITYTITGGCGGTASAFQTLRVDLNANAGTVSGTSPLCIGGTATYSSTGDAGGTWSSDNGAVATVNPTSGLVTAVSAGSANITYTVTGCNGPASASQSVTVDPNVNAGTVSGTSPLCIGGTATYSSTGDAGGTWSSDKAAQLRTAAPVMQAEHGAAIMVL
ncbi:MAG: Ig-like domain-containing protein [Sphingobacteriales bacterium]|nr:Ig-like domain-containing protein [Sphingobacteriales bacterium]